MEPYAFCDGRVSNFFSPNKIILGCGASRLVGAEAKALGVQKALIVTDPGLTKAGMVERITRPLLDEGIDLVVYDRAELETPARVIDECAGFARKEKCNVVIAFGGGTVLDTTKGVSLMAVNRGRVLDYEGLDRVPIRGLPKIMIPTTAGSGSEVTRVFALTDEATRTKKVVYTSHNLADVVVLDPLLTLTLPPLLTAETGLDALAHAVEAYTSTKATPFSDVFALEATRLVGRSLLPAYARGGDVEARFDMLLAASLAGLACASGGLGALHALSFEIETDHGIGHARAISALLPHVMEHNKIAVLRRFKSIAEALGEDVAGLSDYQGAGMAVAAVYRLLGNMDISNRLSDYGVHEHHVPKMVAQAMRQTRLFGQNARSVTEQDISDIYLRALKPI
jgi:alcohol dehydrogenase